MNENRTSRDVEVAWTNRRRSATLIRSVVCGFACAFLLPGCNEIRHGQAGDGGGQDSTYLLPDYGERSDFAIGSIARFTVDGGKSALPTGQPFPVVWVWDTEIRGLAYSPTGSELYALVPPMNCTAGNRISPQLLIELPGSWLVDTPLVGCRAIPSDPRAAVDELLVGLEDRLRVIESSSVAHRHPSLLGDVRTARDYASAFAQGFAQLPREDQEQVALSLGAYFDGDDSGPSPAMDGFEDTRRMNLTGAGMIAGAGLAGTGLATMVIGATYLPTVQGLGLLALGFGMFLSGKALLHDRIDSDIPVPRDPLDIDSEGGSPSSSSLEAVVDYPVSFTMSVGMESLNEGLRAAAQPGPRRLVGIIDEFARAILDAPATVRALLSSQPPVLPAEGLRERVRATPRLFSFGRPADSRIRAEFVETAAGFSVTFTAVDGTEFPLTTTVPVKYLNPGNLETTTTITVALDDEVPAPSLEEVRLSWAQRPLGNNFACVGKPSFRIVGGVRSPTGGWENLYIGGQHRYFHCDGSEYREPQITWRDPPLVDASTPGYKPSVSGGDWFTDHWPTGTGSWTPLFFVNQRSPGNCPFNWDPHSAVGTWYLATRNPDTGEYAILDRIDRVVPPDEVCR